MLSFVGGKSLVQLIVECRRGLSVLWGVINLGGFQEGLQVFFVDEWFIWCYECGVIVVNLFGEMFDFGEEVIEVVDDEEQWLYVVDFEVLVDYLFQLEGELLYFG